MTYLRVTFLKEAEYISESKLKGKMRTWSSKVSNITLFYMNARSLNKHMDEINILIDNPKFKFTILCFTETWLNDETSDLSSIKGYTDVHTFRNTKSGGGVSIYISDTLNFTTLENLTNTSKHIESLFIRIDKREINTTKDVIIGCVYRPPNGDFKQFIESYQEVLDTISATDCFICGDFNIDISAKNTKSEQFLNTNLASNITPMITKPTRSHKKSNTVIDNIITNIPSKVEETGIVLSDITDHYPLYIITSHEKQSDKAVDIENITFKFNIGQFITNIKLSNWNTILNLKDTETTYDCLHDIISKHYRDALSPKINNKSNYKKRLPWLTHTLKNLIKEKNALYIKAKKSNTEENKKEYKQCKRRLNKEMKQAKRLYYNNKITENLSDPAKYWSIITEIIDKRKTKENSTYFVDDLGQKNEGCLEISTNFNKYFTNVGPKLASNIPSTQKDFSSYLHHRNPQPYSWNLEQSKKP